MTELPIRAAATTTGDNDLCTHRGCHRVADEDVLTLASAVTLIRTFGCLALVFAYVATGNVALLFAGLGVHLVGDIADGWIARRTDSETRSGAVLDVVCDRLCVALYYGCYGQLHHDMLVPIGLFLLSFMVLDSYLSLAFLHWPLRSPNYFFLIDGPIYRWNWSPAGKAANGGLALVMLATRSPMACTVLTLGVGLVKVVSLVRLHRISVPIPVGCAAVST